MCRFIRDARPLIIMWCWVQPCVFYTHFKWIWENIWITVNVTFIVSANIVCIPIAKRYLVHGIALDILNWTIKWLFCSPFMFALYDLQLLADHEKILTVSYVFRIDNCICMFRTHMMVHQYIVTAKLPDKVEKIKNKMTLRSVPYTYPPAHMWFYLLYISFPFKTFHNVCNFPHMNSRWNLCVLFHIDFYYTCDIIRIQISMSIHILYKLCTRGRFAIAVYSEIDSNFSSKFQDRMFDLLLIPMASKISSRCTKRLLGNEDKNMYIRVAAKNIVRHGRHSAYFMSSKATNIAIRHISHSFMTMQNVRMIQRLTSEVNTRSWK